MLKDCGGDSAVCIYCGAVHYALIKYFLSREVTVSCSYLPVFTIVLVGGLSGHLFLYVCAFLFIIDLLRGKKSRITYFCL